MLRRPRPPRVFLGLTEVAGYYRNLERGFRELGIDAHFFDLSGNPWCQGLVACGTYRLKQYRGDVYPELAAGHLRITSM